jgi:hypothetical protein
VLSGLGHSGTGDDQENIDSSGRKIKTLFSNIQINLKYIYIYIFFFINVCILLNFIVQNGNNLEDNAADSNENQQNKKGKQKRARMKKSTYIVENLDNITAKIRDDFKDVC